MRYKIITEVATEPVTLEDVKKHLRLDTGDAENALLNGMIATAREYGELITRRAFATQTIEAFFDSFPRCNLFELPMPPLRSVEVVKYKNGDGDETTLSVDDDYIVDSDSDIGRIVLPYGVTWPSFVAYPINPITVRFVCGYENLPKIFRQAMLLHIGFLYKYRDTEIPKEDLDTVNSMYKLRKSRWF